VVLHWTVWICRRRRPVGDRQEAEMNMKTHCGRPTGLPPGTARVVLSAPLAVRDDECDSEEPWLSLTPEEARRLAGLLLFQAAAVDPEPSGTPGEAEVTPIAGDAFEIRVRGHVLTVDQPPDAGGKDTAPTPVELFVSAVASCAAHYAGRFLDRHDLTRDGLRVRARFRTAEDRPPRVAALSLVVEAPTLPPERLGALRAVVSHCTVTNTLARPPEMSLEVRCADGGTSPLPLREETGQEPRT
jgi:uncharacterized OsmC-like protein